ncbi:hypothetical protein N5W20_05290 [Candidatus Kirkpatrickella diaphorinae]|uniref:Uncharacterized protein n=1 Tax=Candidatus Kirkpatrickella diaphorinae TaxID=2984322 RepID=A0ABY6GGC5_9PROT|nr:hypothetical protein [Candidatus Kirkpatrickella diaphorinae]UYH50542.1 hypothetical protein N5W20_05290 [Candidatus Kirkpatrickella diaphorinae]
MNDLVFKRSVVFVGEFTDPSPEIQGDEQLNWGTFARHGGILWRISGLFNGNLAIRMRFP